jgi:hypothetical protein
LQYSKSTYWIITPSFTPKLISIEHIEQLIPEFFQESEHFYLVFLDIEGNVEDSNALFKGLLGISDSSSIFDHLDFRSKQELEGLIDQLMLKPKEQYPVLLQFIDQKRAQSWWEFSMVINSEMDPLGFIGIGVDLNFLERKLPWNHLIDLLNFGKAELDENLEFISAEPLVADWIANGSSELIGKSLLNSGLFELNSFDRLELEKILSTEGVTQFKARVKRASGYFSYSINLLKHTKGFLLFMRPAPKDEFYANNVKPFANEQLDLISGPVWILERNFSVVQQNSLASSLIQQWNSSNSSAKSGFNTEFAGDKSKRLMEIISQTFEGQEKKLAVKITNKTGGSEYWTFHTKVIYSEGKKRWVMIQGIDQSVLYNRINLQEKEIQTLRELAIRPSHILRSPLSSMLGLLDLIDYRKLDEENQKYISYLKPLAQELDEVIRNNAKKMSQLD